jgi:hypothetical protein
LVVSRVLPSGSSASMHTMAGTSWRSARRKRPVLSSMFEQQSNAESIAIGIVLVQPFVAGASLDISGLVCAVAFAIAIPLLAALVLVNHQETFRRRRTSSRIVAVAKATAQSFAFVGVVAGFWHIHWIAGVGLLVSALVAVGVQSAGITRLEFGERPASRAAEAAQEPAKRGDADA